MSLSRFDLFCVGGTSVDLVLRVPRILVSDEKQLVTFEGLVPGGMIANAACAAGRLGLRTGWSGRVGDDDAGKAYLAAFADYDVVVSSAQVLPDSITDLCVVLVEPSGVRSLMIVPTINAYPELSVTVKNELKRSTFAYTIPYALSWFQEFSKAVHAGGGKVVVDVEASIPMPKEDVYSALRMVDIVFCSEEGALFASGKDNVDEAAAEILANGPALVIVTLGARGAAAFEVGHCIKVPGFKVPVVDTTGAGDCFHAAFLAGLLQEKSVEECLLFASAAAAISVGHAGPRGGLPTSVEVEAFLEVKNPQA